jgi:hypothetical protein
MKEKGVLKQVYLILYLILDTHFVFFQNLVFSIQNSAKRIFIIKTISRKLTYLFENMLKKFSVVKLDYIRLFIIPGVPVDLYTFCIEKRKEDVLQYI